MAPMSLLDELRRTGKDLLEHELPSLDEMRQVVGAFVKAAEQAMTDEEIPKLVAALDESVAAPTNEGTGNVGDANGGVPANVQQVMPTADDIAAALIRQGAVPTAGAQIAAPAAPPAVSADIPAGTPAPSPAGTHTADPATFTPSPLPAPATPPEIVFSDEPPALTPDEQLRASLSGRGLSTEVIDAIVAGQGVEAVPAEAPATAPEPPAAAPEAPVAAPVDTTPEA